MNSQQITVHPQKRVVRGQLGEPRRWSHTQHNKILQQLPKAGYCLPLHFLQFSSGLLLPLLLLKLRERLPALLDLLLMLLLQGREAPVPLE